MGGGRPLMMRIATVSLLALALLVFALTYRHSYRPKPPPATGSLDATAPEGVDNDVVLPAVSDVWSNLAVRTASPSGTVSTSVLVRAAQAETSRFQIPSQSPTGSVSTGAVSQ